jgi:hypothetical protein
MNNLSIVALSILCAFNTIVSAASSKSERLFEHLNNGSYKPQREDIENLIAIADDLEELQNIYNNKAIILPLTALGYLADQCGLPNTLAVAKMYIEEHGVDENEIKDAYVRSRLTTESFFYSWTQQPNRDLKAWIPRCLTFERFIAALKPTK